MPRSVTHDIRPLIDSVRDCRICANDLPFGPRPVIQVDTGARILIAGQAPGRRVHDSGVPFDDPSGVRLREWMGISKDDFYDATKVALLPMGFCYPGTGASGDLPPRPECAPAWRTQLMEQLVSVRLTLVIGQYAQRWHLPDASNKVTETVRQWESFAPKFIPLPHPSPRNNIWLKRNPWFLEQCVPYLQARIEELMKPGTPGD